MRKILYSFFYIALTACMIFIVFSCTGEKDLYNPELALKQQIEKYITSFLSKYNSKIDIDNQTWDEAISRYFLNLGSGRGNKENITVTKEGSYSISAETKTWVNDNLNSWSNSTNGAPFTMTMPEGDLYIVPIWINLNINAKTWDFYIVAGSGADAQKQFVLKKEQDQHNVNNNNSSIIKISGIEAGTPIYFYIDVKESNSKNFNNSSIIGKMDALYSCPSNDNTGKIPADAKVTFVGCDVTQNTSNDFKGFIFMCYGTDKNGKIEDVKPNVLGDSDVNEIITKRYMVEDLGSTDDFDFNDIVIDVYAERTVTLHYDASTNNTTIKNKSAWINQKATLCHLGGTLPYTVKIGDTTLPWTEPQLGADPNLTESVKGWNPDTNNIVVTVKGGTGDVVTIPFPKKGEVPMIIAMQESLDWMSERQSIPAEWFTYE